MKGFNFSRILSESEEDWCESGWIWQESVWFEEQSAQRGVNNVASLLFEQNAMVMINYQAKVE